MKEVLNKGITRRDFIKTAAAGAVGVTVLGACAPKSAATAAPAANNNPAAAVATEAPLAKADQTLETDVVVVGIGTSGIMAAANAGANGAKVIAIETLPALGSGNSVNTAGAFGVESSEEKKQAKYVTQEEAFKYLIEGTLYQCNSKVIRSLLANSGPAIDFVTNAGMPFMYEFEMEPDATSMLARTGHLFKVSGKDRADIYQKMLDTNKVTCMYSTTAQKLIKDGDKVVGVQCKSSDDKIIDIKAKSVVIATGGFMASDEMQAKYFAGAKLLAMGSKTNKGDGITMAQAAGAQIGKNFSTSLNECGAGNSKASKRAATVPSENGKYNSAFYLPLFGGLLVDKHGERFFDEGRMCEATMYTGEPVIRSDRYFSIVDKAYLDRLSTTVIDKFLSPSAVANMAPMLRMAFKGVTLTNISDSMDEAIKEGWAFKVDKIEDIAKCFNMEFLSSTIDSYNQFCKDGKDTQFFKKADYLTAISQGPFYIVEFQPCGWVSFGGIKTDGYCRALTASNDVIPGLIMAGTDGDFWSTPYYQGGSAQGFCLASGFLAGATAAKDAKA
jgi:fumarate reductase flavoprotein subunit